MAEIRIAGGVYPLCLTVAVLDDLEKLGLRLKDIDSLFVQQEGEDVQDLMEKSLWLLEVLMRRGSEHEVMEGRLPECEPLALDELRMTLTPGQVMYEVIPAVCATIGEGMGRKIEAAHDTKKAAAETLSP